MQLWPLLHGLQAPGTSRGYLASFYAFRERYCDPQRTRFGMDYSGVSNTAELATFLERSKLFLRRTKQEVLHDLPPKRREQMLFTVRRSAVQTPVHVIVPAPVHARARARACACACAAEAPVRH